MRVLVRSAEQHQRRLGDAERVIAFPINAPARRAAPAPPRTVVARDRGVDDGCSKAAPQPPARDHIHRRRRRWRRALQVAAAMTARSPGSSDRRLDARRTPSPGRRPRRTRVPDARARAQRRQDADAGEATASIDYAITAATAVPPYRLHHRQLRRHPRLACTCAASATRLLAVTLGANRIAPQAAGTSVTFTAVRRRWRRAVQVPALRRHTDLAVVLTGWTTRTPSPGRRPRRTRATDARARAQRRAAPAMPARLTTSIDVPDHRGGVAPAPRRRRCRHERPAVR